MKLKDYIKKLQEIVEQNPKSADFDVVYSMDDEGNGYGEVYYDPIIGYFNNGEFAPFSVDDTELKESDLNCVCIN